MQANRPDQRTALLRAADIPDTSENLFHRLTRAIARQKPLQKPGVAVPQAAAGAIDPQQFQPTEEGSGAFGRWTLDAGGLPAYIYDMNQRRDVRAYFINSEGRDRRDHWHSIGNDHITALASNDGTVQVYLADRGGLFLNHFAAQDEKPPRTLVGYLDAGLRLIVRWFNLLWAVWVKIRTRGSITPRGVSPEPPEVPKWQPEDLTTRHAYSGGFGYLDDGDQTWATAFRYGPSRPETRRVFGIGYYETEMVYRGIRHTRWVYPPCGNDSLLLIDVEIENRRSTAVDVRYYEYWDVNIHQLEVEWIRTGLVVPSQDGQRALLNRRFSPILSQQWDDRALRLHQERLPGAAEEDETRHTVDRHPPDVFLANLGDPADGIYVNKASFFGDGTAGRPAAVGQRQPGDHSIPSLAGPMPYCMVLRHDLYLKPGATIRLHYAYGAVDPDAALGFLDGYRGGDRLQPTVEAWKKRLPYFSTGGDPVLQRETTWHAHNLLGATLYSEHFDTHYTPQGSAYLYLHGADGVPRDQALFTLPMVYVRPDLARQTLTLLMSQRQAENLALPYGFVGDGAISDARGLHRFPSDLDLFFMLALSEYLAATGDQEFLNT
ncbi:MAG TPA: hypothetical protein VMT34_10560, partial [Aggregatilineales bacterium]|nr:hypothetical protein [Aggregatilineales bacterium]